MNINEIEKRLEKSIDVSYNVFKAELNEIKPEVIFATSKPYWIIKSLQKNEPQIFAGFKDKTVIQVPHPANYDSDPTRFLKNSIPMIYALGRAGIIDVNEFLSLAYERYKTVLEKWMEKNT